MPFGSRSSVRKRSTVALLAIAGLGVAGLGGSAQAVPPPAATKATKAPKASGAKDVSVTLITGDRVVLRGGDPAKASVEPGKGRQNIVFNTYRTKGQSYVIPSDVQQALSGGKLDRRLFDVAGLVKAGYDDKSSKTIPVLVTYQGKAKRAALTGATVTRQLPSINGAAVKVDKQNATAFLDATGAKTRSAGFDKIWLDGKRQISLDQSVPQIGGPVAWQAGYTGKGVSVAVLDTGVDATHPDLATQVAGAKNFTTEPDGDPVGHGTHVASTIAGTAAASAGKYKGVAPDAKIYDGKICEIWGCDESAILAGMDWASTELKAKIVNLSLGGQDTPEIDPVEEAVNRLTAQNGTLFVISAGNAGPGDATVGSPGSADAALTVGNVTKQDELSPLSSRGPRIGDGAVKPDVTAPGTDIVAAKSKDSVIGEPVGDKYLRLSGTSMAAPHTAGAAALLLQEHPSWTPAELKGALMGSAKVAADQTSFQQGAGRIDLAAAIKQTVIAEPGSVSFGTASFPHTDDTPVTKDVTFRNLGDQPVTLALASTFNAPDGNPAPAGALKLSASTLTVPAGGTASVQATSDTSLAGPDGLYSGRITATADDSLVVVPIGVDRETERYTLKVKMIRPDGTPDADGGGVLVYGPDNEVFDNYSPDADGVATIRLPKAEYLLDQYQEIELPNDDWAAYKLVAPSVKLTSDQTVVLDARTAKVVNTTIPRAGAEQANSVIGYDRYSADGTTNFVSSMLNFRFGHVFTSSLGPKLPAEQLTGHVTSQWGVKGDGFFTNTPYLYGIANYQPGEFVTGFNRTVRDKDLAVVDQTVNKSTDKQVEKTIYPLMPNVSTPWARVVHLDTPRTVRYYLDPTPGGWQTQAQETTGDNPFGAWSLVGDATQYRAGKTYRERWNAATISPKVALANRTADALTLSVSNYTDADGHVGGIQPDSASSTLYRDGEQVSSAPAFGFATASGLPAGKAAYKFVTSGTQTVSGLSSRIDLTLTFNSAATTEEKPLPARTIRFQPDVDGNNTVKRTPVTVLPIVLDGTPGATLPAVKKLEVQVSGDDGKTWQKASVVPAGQGYKAIFATPKGAAVSLRAHLVDAAGNSTDQTVLTAYPIR